MTFSLKKKKNILGGRKRSPGITTDRMGLSRNKEESRGTNDEEYY